MAEFYQIATGSKKISNLASISGISGSAVIPVVMSNVAGGIYPITNGTTNQISYEDFRESVIENNANVFTTTQTVRVGSGNNQQQTTLEGHDFIMSTGSLVTPVGTEGFKVQLFANDGTPGAKLYTYDNTEATPANRFKTFMEVGTGYGDVTFTRPVSFTSPLIVNNNLLVNGVLTARQVQTSIVTSSVQYESGSTRFGDTFEDTHEFTGSLKVSGSLALNTLTQNRVLLVGSNGTLTDSSNLTFNGTILGINATSVNTTAYVNINGNGLKVDGVINNPLIGAVTQSLIDIAGGLQSYTASLKSAAIVSSSQQILNYNIFATTGSNTFRADQVITGSLSISAGEFNVTTGSGNMTSSLIFDHTQNDGVTLGLRHNDRLSVADHTFNVKVWAGGVYTDFIRNGTPYTILNVEAFDDNKIYLYRDTRLYNKSLTIDKELLVKQNAKITGSFNVTSGSGFLTSSIEFIHNTISPSQGSSTFEVRHINSQSSENFAVKLFADDYIAKMQYEKNGSTYDILRTNLAGDLHLTRDTRLFGTGLTVDDSLLVKGVITGSILATNGVVSSSNQLIELNTFTGSLSTSATNINSFTASQISVNALTQAVTSSLLAQTASQGLVNDLTQAVTSSLIGIVGGLQGYTASLKGVAIVSSSNQLFELNNQTGSQDSVNNLTSAVTSSLITIVGGLQGYTASLKAVAIVSSSNQLFELNNQTGSQDSVNNLTSAVTSSLIGIVGGLQSYTASLKGQAIVSSSQQITNYFTFAQTSSANIFYNYQAISGSKLELHTSDANGGIVVNSKATTSQTFMTFLDRGTNDNYTVGTFVDINGTNQLGGLAIVGHRKDNQSGLVLRGQNKVANSNAVNGYITAVIGNAYSDNALTTLTTGVTGKSISFLGQDTELANLNFNGDLTITNGNLVVASGKGIDFSVNTGGAGKSSQLLDDYEEGTITGTITCGTSGTVTLDAGYNTLSYTKIGGVVHVFGNLSVTSVSSPVGYFTIPLPFACVNLGDSAGTTVANIVVNGTNTANTSDFVGWIDETQSNVIVRLGNATGVQNTSANELKALTDIYLQVTYRTT